MEFVYVPFQNAYQQEACIFEVLCGAFTGEYWKSFMGTKMLQRMINYGIGDLVVFVSWRHRDLKSCD